jgi:hypothetical protein
MTPEEILAIDVERNHPPGTTVGNLRAAINENYRNNGQMVQQGNTLIIFNNGKKEGDVEYHCFSADTPENLVRNVMKFFEMLKKLGCKTATTTYEDSKISQLFDQYISQYYEVDIRQVDGQFEAEVRL